MILQIIRIAISTIAKIKYRTIVGLERISAIIFTPHFIIY